MVRLRALQVRVTRDQYERLKQAATNKGFASLSSYVRYVTLEHESFIERKILEIHQHLIKERP
jgi:hypothetical protein